MRKFEGEKLVIATHNAGKLKEIRELIAPLGIEVVSAGELGLPEPEENGTTFESYLTLVYLIKLNFDLLKKL